MYVVKRAFRNYGQMMIPGSIVEPGSVKRFKSRFNDGYIIYVRECDIDKWDNYFRVRFGMSLVEPTHEEAAPADDTAVHTEAPIERTPNATVKPVKPVVKVVLK